MYVCIVRGLHMNDVTQTETDDTTHEKGIVSLSFRSQIIAERDMDREGIQGSMVYCTSALSSHHQRKRRYGLGYMVVR